MQKAIIYIRVSTDEQADKGYSLRHQEEYLRRYCEMNNILVVELIKEDYSAKTFNRPAFNAILGKLKSRQVKADLLVFTKWDRFSRNAPDAYAMISTLNKIGVEPQAVEQPLDLTIPENKIMLAFYLSAPEVENDRRALNTLVGMRRAKKEGRWTAPAPCGYDNKLDDQNRKSIIPNKNAPIIRWAFETLSTGQYSVEEVRRMCNAKGLKLEKNRFNQIMKAPVYCSRIIIPAYKNEEEQVKRGIFEPIISEELFDKVQEVMTGRRAKLAYKVCAKDELPLRGFLDCPRCGKKLCGSGSRGKSGRIHFYYHCLKGCKERVRANDVNVAFSNFLSSLKFKTGVNEVYNEIIKTLFKSNAVEKGGSQGSIMVEMDKLKLRLNKAQQMMLDGEMTMPEYREIKQLLEPKIDQLLSQQLAQNHVEVEYRSYLKRGLTAVQNLGYLYDRLDVTGRQQLIRSSLKQNAVFSDGRVRTPELNSLITLTTYADAAHSQSLTEKGSHFGSLSRMVPYGLDLSNFMDDFQRIRILMNSRSWKSLL